MTSTSGARYEGLWQESARHGQGTHWDVEGVVYKGGLVADKREGKRMLLYPDGSLFLGNFHEDLIEGEGRFFVAEAAFTQTWVHTSIESLPGLVWESLAVAGKDEGSEAVACPPSPVASIKTGGEEGGGDGEGRIGAYSLSSASSEVAWRSTALSSSSSWNGRTISVGDWRGRIEEEEVEEEEEEEEEEAEAEEREGEKEGEEGRLKAQLPNVTIDPAAAPAAAVVSSSVPLLEAASVSRQHASFSGTRQGDCSGAGDVTQLRSTAQLVAAIAVTPGDVRAQEQEQQEQQESEKEQQRGGDQQAQQEQQTVPENAKEAGEDLRQEQTTPVEVLATVPSALSTTRSNSASSLGTTAPPISAIPSVSPSPPALTTSKQSAQATKSARAPQQQQKKKATAELARFPPVQRKAFKEHAGVGPAASGGRSAFLNKPSSGRSRRRASIPRPYESALVGAAVRVLTPTSAPIGTTGSAQSNAARDGGAPMQSSVPQRWPSPLSSITPFFPRNEDKREMKSEASRGSAGAKKLAWGYAGRVLAKPLHPLLIT